MIRGTWGDLRSGERLPRGEDEGVAVDVGRARLAGAPRDVVPVDVGAVVVDREFAGTRAVDPRREARVAARGKIEDVRDALLARNETPERASLRMADVVELQREQR